MNNTCKLYKSQIYGAFQHKNAIAAGIISALPCYLRSSVAVKQFINLLNK